MKGCNKISNLFGAYLYNSVTPAERATVEEHISQCAKCANDLLSRRKVLEILKPPLQPGEMPQRTQDNFAWNVYRKIALDSLKRRSRQTFLRRFVLQPALAVIMTAIGVAVFVSRFQPGQVIVNNPTTVVMKTDGTDRKDLRASLYVEEFFKRQGIPQERESNHTKVDKVSTDEQPSLKTGLFTQGTLVPDSKRLLEDADFINFSLGDRRRALAEYQRLVDYYPDTDAAIEARDRVKSIRETEYRIQVVAAEGGF